MSDATTNLALPYLMAAQSQKHVTHNEALRALDAVTQLAVLDRDRTAPPITPAEGDRYIVATGATGVWAGKTGQVAAFQDNAWAFHTPRDGWLAWVADEDLLYVFDATIWTPCNLASVNPVALVGVNATADATNRLAVASAASLFSHDGAGHQHKINKASASETASLLFQTGFSGRAEMGTTGDDDFHLKVSPDGASWNDAILIDRSTGAVSLPNSTILGGAPNPWTGKKWAALGTSITSGGAYTGPLTTLLGVTLTNLGVSGGSLSSSAASGPQAIYDEIVNIPADAALVTVEAGFNDFGAGATLGAMGDTTLATFYGALYKAAQDILAADPRRTLVFIIPYTIYLDAHGAGSTYFTQWMRAIRDTARLFGCPVIDLGGEGALNVATAALYLNPDGVHPNSVGGARYAQYVYNNLVVIEPCSSTLTQLDAPTSSVAGGTYASAQTVALTPPQWGAKVYCTLDGSTPTVGSLLYSAPLTISGDMVVKAISVLAPFTISLVTTATYVISSGPVATPIASPAAGTYLTAQSVALFCATAGATIYYTTNGSTPTTSSSVYTGPITVAASETIKAYAVKSGRTDSSVLMGAYTIGVAASTFDPSGHGLTGALTNGDRDWATTSAAYTTARGSLGHSTGAFYFEIEEIATNNTNFTEVGVMDATTANGAGLDAELKNVASAVGWFSGGIGATGPAFNASLVTNPGSFGPTAGTIWMVAVDFSTGSVFFGHDGIWPLGAPTVGSATGCSGVFSGAPTLYPGASVISIGLEKVRSRFASSQQAYSPPTGFTAWG
jgi:lysophospholipase L1-like esterase